MNSSNLNAKEAMKALLQHLQTTNGSIQGFSISNETRVNGKIDTSINKFTTLLVLPSLIWLIFDHLIY